MTKSLVQSLVCGDFSLSDQFLITGELFVKRHGKLIGRGALGAQALKDQLLFDTIIAQGF